jgi:hypothetical protein
LRDVFDRDVGTTAMLETLRRKFQVPEDAWKAAVAEEMQQAREANLADQRKHFTPHLWVETRDSWRYPLFVPLFCYRRIEISEDWQKLVGDKDIIGTVGQFVAEFHRSVRRLTPKEAERVAQAEVFGEVRAAVLNMPKEQVAHYLYRPSFELAYRFAPDGTFVGKVEGSYLAPVTWLSLR